MTGYFPLILAAGSLLLAAFWVLRWRQQYLLGLIGKSADRHARCASCGYDLTGKDVESFEQIEATSCPECGRAIHSMEDTLLPAKGAKRPTHAYYLSMFITQFFVGASMLFVFTATNSTQTAVHSRSPTATLLKEMKLPGNTPLPSNTAYELDYRLRNDELSQAEQQQLINNALQYQANPGKKWDYLLGEWIEQARAQGQLSDKQWQQYLKNAYQTQIEVREHLYAGDPFIISLDTSTYRVSIDYQFEFIGSMNDVNALMTIYPDTAEISPAAISSDRIEIYSYRLADYVLRTNDQKPYQQGRYKVVVDLTLSPPDPKHNNTPRKHVPLQLAANFEIHPHTDTLFVPVTNLNLARQLQDQIEQEIHQSGGTKFRTFGSDRYLSLRLKDPPSQFAGGYDVSVTMDGFTSTRQWSYEPNSPGNQWREFTFRIPDQLVQSAADPAKPFQSFSLWLTPNPELLKHTLKGYEYLDHTLVIRDIPIGLPDP